MEQSFATLKAFIIPLVAIIWPTRKNKVKFLSPHFWSITAVSGKQFSICVWKLLDHLIGPTDMTTAASTTTTTTTTMTLTTVPHKDFVIPRTASILDDCWNEITIWKKKKEKNVPIFVSESFLSSLCWNILMGAMTNVRATIYLMLDPHILALVMLYTLAGPF